MYLDFHTHGKLAKYLPFSPEYTDWLLSEARSAGLDAVCLTEHFNTKQFAELYRYIAGTCERDGDTFVREGLRIFPGMETDIAEGGHVLTIGPIDAILELNLRLESHKRKGAFLPAEKLLELFRGYPVLVGAGHPFREGSHIPELPEKLLSRFDFLDLNGKDVAGDRESTERRTRALGERLHRPVVAGSDTHQALQYGCIRTAFERECTTFGELAREMVSGRYRIEIHPEAAFRVKAAVLLKRSLKEIHALGGDYVSVLLGKQPEPASAEFPAKEFRKNDYEISGHAPRFYQGRA